MRLSDVATDVAGKCSRQRPHTRTYTRTPIPKGACEGVCACSTCHVILEEETFDALDDPSEEEEDMLDQAFGLTPTSRLGCQVELTQAMDGMKVGAGPSSGVWWRGSGS